MRPPPAVRLLGAILRWACDRDRLGAKHDGKREDLQWEDIWEPEFLRKQSNQIDRRRLIPPIPPKGFWPLFMRQRLDDGIVAELGRVSPIAPGDTV